MTEAQLQYLLNELKSYLKITWSEEDEELLKHVKRGAAYLDGLCGTVIDYSEDLFAQQLLLDYGRYVYNHSLELFEINFASELSKLSIREGVKAYEAANTETSS
ncbi:hypothetical protein SAMN05421743_12141 [Thalassobacillus cyri]|uniref:Phage gp6-like head-tail connector protein n=1 Tax=Thalassobacillus cyri TaxID=571932 RepID=A0A1H4H1Q6_9BACI|nr:hypothetical protein [Thalassobacillus cyri]SEB15769.1 hypothetical protein SAMN05421743_12141 [Thalassobacillus cyri]